MDRAAFWAAVLALIASLASNVVQFMRNNKDDASQLRKDLMDMSESLREEVSRLGKRVKELEDELHGKTRQLLNHEIHLARIKSVLIEKHQIDLDALFPQDAPKS